MPSYVMHNQILYLFKFNAIENEEKVFITILVIIHLVLNL